MCRPFGSWLLRVAPLAVVLLRVARLAVGLLRVARLAVGLLAAACGGASAPVETPTSSESTTTEVEADEPDEPEPPPAPSCNDQSCLSCGQGICPLGAYCDSGAPGGPACAWVPECPDKPSCACVNKALGGECSCTDSATGPTVACPN